MTKFLAVDPGTYHTGVALFDGSRLLDCWALDAARNDPVEKRIGAIINQLEAITAKHGEGLKEVVCERPMGIDSHRPAPELQVLVRRLRSWARQSPRRYKWVEYHPSTVLAQIRPRGLGRTASSKLALQLGVKMVYGDQIDPNQAAQDVTDAVAVGHCHLCKRLEREAVR